MPGSHWHWPSIAAAGGRTHPHPCPYQRRNLNGAHVFLVRRAESASDHTTDGVGIESIESIACNCICGVRNSAR